MGTANEVASVVLKTTLVPVAIMGGVLIYNMNDEVNKIKQEGALSTIVGPSIADDAKQTVHNLNQVTAKAADKGVLPTFLGDKTVDKLNKDGAVSLILGDKMTDNINQKGVLPTVLGDEMTDNINQKGVLPTVLGDDMATNINKKGVIKAILGEKVANNLDKISDNMADPNKGVVGGLVGENGVTLKTCAFDISIMPNQPGPQKPGILRRTLNTTTNAVKGVWNHVFGTSNSSQSGATEENNTNNTQNSSQPTNDDSNSNV